jgi:hypothetical protein
MTVLNRRRPLAAMLLIASVACRADERAEDASRVPTSAHDTAAADAATAVCLQGEPFVADGAVPLRAASIGGAARIGALRWERHDGCERFVVDLEPVPQAPPTEGRVEVEVLRELGVVRVTLAGVRDVSQDATDATFDGPLARAAYSAWGPDGRSTFVDLHLARPAEARATVLRDPARVVVDVRPGGGPVPEPAASHRRVVVLAPRPGAASYPLRVTGYARTFEANVVVRLEQGGREVRETFTTATAWADAWGHFMLTLDDGPSGRVTLRVGEYSARDGTWEGVAIELVMHQDDTPPVSRRP